MINKLPFLQSQIEAQRETIRTLQQQAKLSKQLIEIERLVLSVVQRFPLTIPEIGTLLNAWDGEPRRRLWNVSKRRTLLLARGRNVSWTWM
jgi:hypothetical protein